MSEFEEQCALFEWAAMTEGKIPQLALLHMIPNGAKLPWRKNKQGKRYSPEAFRLKNSGLKNGVPDICLPVPAHGWHGLYIELKYGINKQTADQKRWQEMLLKQGYLAVVCNGWLVAQKVILRELKEELDLNVEPDALDPFAFASHAYPDLHLLMPFYTVTRWSGEPKLDPNAAQALAWVRPHELRGYAMPPADVVLVEH